jgi:isoleucyl-tRNA synthetase
LEKYGADATRWYMIANAAPWDNLKFDIEGISEVQRKLFGTLYNTYGFFALYANVDGFVVDQSNTVAYEKRAELDRWILSKLNSLIKDVTEQYENFEPHKAAREIEEFVDEHLSNWYIRLSRRRFWKGEMSEDKKAAYETLFECLNTLSKLMSPIAPFFADWLYNNLNDKTADIDSVHLSNYPKINESFVDLKLEKRMEMAQKISSMVLSVRKKENLKVRQPLQKIQIPVLDAEFKQHVESVKEIILAEVNVKELELVTEEQVQIVKNLKLNFKTLGKKCGKHMKTVQAFANDNGPAIISAIEKTGQYKMNIEGDEIVLENEDVEIIPVDIPGWKVANSGQITVALDVTVTQVLKEEGLARELVNRIQNLRKDIGLELTDKILVKIQQNDALNTAIKNNLNYICAETLTGDLQVVQNLSSATASSVEVDELVSTLISIEKLN